VIFKWPKAKNPGLQRIKLHSVLTLTSDIEVASFECCFLVTNMDHSHTSCHTKLLTHVEACEGRAG
jgi:hypothetical protein